MTFCLCCSRDPFRPLAAKIPNKWLLRIPNRPSVRNTYPGQLLPSQHEAHWRTFPFSFLLPRDNKISRNLRGLKRVFVVTTSAAVLEIVAFLTTFLAAGLFLGPMANTVPPLEPISGTASRQQSTMCKNLTYLQISQWHFWPHKLRWCKRVWPAHLSPWRTHKCPQVWAPNRSHKGSGLEVGRLLHQYSLT